MTGSTAMIALALLIAFADAAPGDDWWSVPVRTNYQGITALYVERSTITRENQPRTAWIYETFDPSVTHTATKREQLEVDCAAGRYLGLRWYWADDTGEESSYFEPDVHWTSVVIGSPMDAAAKFICSQP